MDLRTLMSLLIGISLCLCIWHITLVQESKINEKFYYKSPSNSSLEANILNLPKNDFKKLINLENFEYLMNPKTCQNLIKPPIIIILIHSAPENFQKRKMIRETWGKSNSYVLLLFLLGNVKSSKLQHKLNFENQIKGDIVQGNFYDNYRNMTYKHVMALKWFIYECPKAQFLLKIDDDILVNLPLLLKILEDPSMSLAKILNSKGLIYCHKLEKSKVHRTNSKWQLTYAEYPKKYFPTFCPGFAILYSTDVVSPLYLKAQKMSFFWIDDVHITGNIASSLNISITSFDEVYLDESVQKGILKGELNVEDFPFIFSFSQLKIEDMKSLWNLIKNKENLLKQKIKRKN